jgi:putative ABC transport system permease protein
MLTLATLRTRWASFAGTFVALSLGVALIATTMLVLVSAAPRLPDRYAGAAVVVQSPEAGDDGDGHPEHRPWAVVEATALAQRLAAVDGVRAAVPDPGFYAQVLRDGEPVAKVHADDRDGLAFSAAALAPYRLTSGHAPTGPGEIVLGTDQDGRAGDRITLLTAAGPAPYTVTGTLDGPGLYLADAEAARLAGGIMVIGLRTSSGVASSASIAAEVRRLVGADGEVLTGAARSALEPEQEARIRWISTQILTAMASLAGFVSIFVVASTFAFGVHQRRREFGLLRAVGATPRQVRRAVYGEALVVGVVAAVAGALFSLVLAPVLGRLLASGGLVRSDLEVRITLWPLAASVGIGLVVALLGVWSASRRAGRVRPMEALREAAVEKRPMTRSRWAFGGFFLVGGIALVVGTASTKGDESLNYALYAAMTLMVSLTLLAPVIIPPIVRLACWPLLRSRGATGVLVREGSLIAVRRVASTAAPVLVTVGFAVLIAGYAGTVGGAVVTENAQTAGAPVVVRPVDGVPGLSDAAVAAVPGETVSALYSAVYANQPGAGPREVPTVGVDPASLAGGAGKLTFDSGTAADLREPGTLAVTAGTAAQFGWQRGANVRLAFHDGQSADLRVAAILTDGSSPASILLARDTVRAHDPTALTDAVFVNGASEDEAAAAVRGFGAEAVDVHAYAAGAGSDEDDLVRLFVLVLIGISAGYSGIAIANTLLMATVDRVRDFAVLRLSGATAGQVLRMVAAEAALVVGVGTALGAAVATAALLGARSSLAQELGAPVTLVFPWAEAGLVVAVSLALALAASVLPARLALRGPAGAPAQR